MKKTIAENMVDVLISHNRKSVWYGDISIIEECAFKSNIQKQHPQQTIKCILNALDHSEMFDKSYIFSDHSGEKRKYRCFTIKF